MTILGLALVALLPAVRSTPGLSRTPRRGLAPVVLAFVAADPMESDSDQADPSSFPSDRPGEGPCDSEALAEESSPAAWLTVRPSRGREADGARGARDSSTLDIGGESPPVRPARRNSLILNSTRTGVSVRLCRLLF